MFKKIRFKRQSILCLIAVIFIISASPVSSAEKKTIGVIMTGDIPYYTKMHKAFTAKLSKEGYGDVEVLLQKPYPDLISWSNAARKLIALDTDIIITYGAPAASAVINEKTGIPVVYAGIHYPNAIGITGKNMTGSVSKVPVSSLLRYLKGIAAISNLGVLYSELEKDCVQEVRDLENLSKDLGIKIIRIDIRRPDDLKKIKASGKLDALFMTSSASVNIIIDSILDFAKANKLPTASLLKGESNSGVIVTLSASPEEQGELAAEKVMKILQGIPIETIPQTNGKNIELIFNLKENMAMGFKTPMGLVTEATRIIQ